MPDLPEPLAQGDLTQTPFAHVLLHIRKKELTGSLVVWRTDVAEGQPRQDRIRFYQGAPVKALLTEPSSKIERGLLPICARASGPYAFYEGVDLVGEGARVREGKVDVLALIAASLRGSSRDDVAGEIVRRFGDSMLRLKSRVDIHHMGLLPDERNTIDLIRAKPMTAAKLRTLSPLEPKMVLRLIYFMAITGSIEPWDGQVQKPAPRERSPFSGRKSESKGDQQRRHGTPDMPPEPPDGLSPEHRERWLEIKKRCHSIENQNYFDMLGIPRDASGATVQKAYFGLVKKWHPDRLDQELAALRPFVERVFRYITRANETLEDTEERAQYLATVQEGGGTPEKDRELAAIVEAAMEFRKIEVMMRRKEWDKALSTLDEILAMAPDEPDYLATRAFLLFQTSGGGAEHKDQIKESLNAALKVSPNNDKAHYYMGVALKRWGQPGALTHFKRAAELNPKNIEAVREVRLAEMRGTIPPETRDKKKKSGDKGGSIFGKLFGGKKK